MHPLRQANRFLGSHVVSRPLSQREAIEERTLIAYLREHPLSTADEIFKATGLALVGRRYIRGKRYNGQWVWRLNHPKLKRDGLR